MPVASRFVAFLVGLVGSSGVTGMSTGSLVVVVLLSTVTAAVLSTVAVVSPFLICLAFSLTLTFSSTVPPLKGSTLANVQVTVWLVLSYTPSLSASTKSTPSSSASVTTTFAFLLRLLTYVIV